MASASILAHFFKRVSILMLFHYVVVNASSIKDGFKCSKHTDCVTGLHCVGHKGDERCKRPMIAGEYCGDPTWVCAKDLDCQKLGDKEICVKVLSAGGYKCKDKGHVCATGLKCVGKPGFERCKKPMGYGQYCGDPTWVCGDGLTCEGVRKEAVCVKTLSAGDPCGGKFDRCAKGTTCENKKCVKSDDEKKPSVSPSSKPDDSKVTPKPEPSSKSKPTVSPSPKASEETKTPTDKKKPKRCNPAKADCEAGYLCVGFKGREICKKPMKEGESCKDATWVCDKGLDCVGTGLKAVCRRPAPKEKTLSKGCGKSKKVCATDEFCVGFKGREVCKRRMKEGESCKDPTWVCADGLYCIGGGPGAYCSKTAGLGQACGRGNRCPKGLRCHRNWRGISRCKKMLGVGADCGTEKNTFCVYGYHCLGAAGKKKCTKARRRKRRKKAGQKKDCCCKCKK